MKEVRGTHSVGHLRCAAPHVPQTLTVCKCLYYSLHYAQHLSQCFPARADAAPMGFFKKPFFNRFSTAALRKGLSRLDVYGSGVVGPRQKRLHKAENWWVRDFWPASPGFHPCPCICPYVLHLPLVLWDHSQSTNSTWNHAVMLGLDGGGNSLSGRMPLTRSS